MERGRGQEGGREKEGDFERYIGSRWIGIVN